MKLSAPRLAGVLFIMATVASLSASALMPGMNGADDLAPFATQGSAVTGAALLYFISFFAGAGIAIAMYPVMRRVNVGLALGSVVFRTMEALLYLVGLVSLLSLGSMSQQSIAAGTADRAAIGVVGGLMSSVHDYAGVAGVFAFCVGAFLYYALFFQARLLPRWLSGWGIAALVPMAVACVLALSNDRPVTGYALLALPIFLQELVLAAWLIVKGFDTSASAAEQAGRTPMSRIAATGSAA
jgi:hypothetical protein